MALGTGAAAMTRKSKRKSKMRHLTSEERKSIGRLIRFYTTMHKGLALAKTNDEVWKDMEGTLKALQRIALHQATATLKHVKALEKQTKHGPDMNEMTSETISDKIKLANTLLTQGMHWDKVDGALLRARCLCANEDELLRCPREFTGAELAAPPQPPDEPAD